jgi:polyhydroxyalkanoate synthesis regulator phasin
MANGGRPCCILGVCCPPGSAEQLDALTQWLIKHTNLKADEAKAAVDKLASDAKGPQGA